MIVGATNAPAGTSLGIATSEPAPFGLARGDSRADVVGSIVGGERPEVHPCIHWVADDERVSAVDEVRHELVVDQPLDDDATGGRALLAGGEERTASDHLGGSLDVGIGQDDGGVLSAQFHLTALPGGRCSSA